MNLSIVILAAGKGTRMHSSMPKVLHTIAGKSMLERIVNTAQALSPEHTYVVYGHQEEQVHEKLSHLAVNWIKQEQQLGTGHALLQTLPQIPEDHKVLVLCGDTPLISLATLQEIISSTPEDAVGLVTAHFEKTYQLGRILRDHSGNFLGIIEHKEASGEQKKITEINSGTYVFPAKYLYAWLPELSNENVQNEYYLTDLLAIAVNHGVQVVTVFPEDGQEVLGINDRVQQAQLERYYQRQQAQQLMKQGVTILDPARFDVRGSVDIAKDVTIDVNVILEGHVTIGEGSYIGPNTIIRDSIIGENVSIYENSVLSGAEVANNAQVGPFARLRPGAVLHEDTKVGNFVEIKKSILGAGTKINHLSYIGDASIGSDVNVGAGTITCNYDGVNKNKTTIGDNVFVGSGTQLVAPVKIGKDSFIGAGSTISKDTPEAKLTLSRAKQQTFDSWSPPTKKEEEVS